MRCSRWAGSTGGTCSGAGALSARSAENIAPMGPLAGLRVLEFEAIGPGPFAGMMLADMGGDVLLVDRPADAELGFGRERRFDVMLRGRRSLVLDLKSAS